MNVCVSSCVGMFIFVSLCLGMYACTEVFSKRKRERESWGGEANKLLSVQKVGLELYKKTNFHLIFFFLFDHASLYITDRSHQILTENKIKKPSIRVSSYTNLYHTPGSIEPHPHHVCHVSVVSKQVSWKQSHQSLVLFCFFLLLSQLPYHG